MQVVTLQKTLTVVRALLAKLRWQPCLRGDAHPANCAYAAPLWPQAEPLWRTWPRAPLRIARPGQVKAASSQLPCGNDSLWFMQTRSTTTSQNRNTPEYKNQRAISLPSIWVKQMSEAACSAGYASVSEGHCASSRQASVLFQEAKCEGPCSFSASTCSHILLTWQGWRRGDAIVGP